MLIDRFNLLQKIDRIPVENNQTDPTKKHSR